MNPVAIEGHLTLVLIQWMIIIAAAWVFGQLGGRILRQPLAVGEIAAGIILGPSVFGAICTGLANHFNSPAIGDIPAKIFPHETQTSMQLLGKLGLIFLLFQVGMEFDYSHLRTKSRNGHVGFPFRDGHAVFLRTRHRAVAARNICAGQRRSSALNFSCASRFRSPRCPSWAGFCWK